MADRYSFSQSDTASMFFSPSLCILPEERGEDGMLFCVSSGRKKVDFRE